MSYKNTNFIKVTEEVFKMVKTLVGGGYTYVDAGKAAGVSRTTVQTIMKAESLEDYFRIVNEKDKGVQQKSREIPQERKDNEILDHIDRGMELVAGMLCELVDNSRKTIETLEEIRKKDVRASLQWSPFMAESEKKKMEIITVINNKLGKFLDQWEKFTE